MDPFEHPIEYARQLLDEPEESLDLSFSEPPVAEDPESDSLAPAPHTDAVEPEQREPEAVPLDVPRTPPAESLPTPLSPDGEERDLTLDVPRDTDESMLPVDVPEGNADRELPLGVPGAVGEADLSVNMPPSPDETNLPLDVPQSMPERSLDASTPDVPEFESRSVSGPELAREPDREISFPELDLPEEGSIEEYLGEKPAEEARLETPFVPVGEPPPFEDAFPAYPSLGESLGEMDSRGEGGIRLDPTDPDANEEIEREQQIRDMVHRETMYLNYSRD